MMNTADAVPLALGSAAVGGLIMLLLSRLFRLCCSGSRRSGFVSSSSLPSHVEPLLVNGQVEAGRTKITPTNNSLQPLEVRPEYSNLITLSLFVVSASSVLVGGSYVLIKYHDAIWKSGFVAALLIGGVAFALRTATLWFIRNVVVRRFYTTMQLSRENKESTPGVT